MENKSLNLNKVCDLIESFCTEEWKDTIEMNKTISKYPSNAKIFEEGTEANVVQIIETGKVKITSTFGKNERIIRLASDGMIIGHRGFGGQNHYSVSAVSLTPLKLISIPRKIFDNVLKSNPYFCYHLLMFFADELKNSEKLFKIMTTMQVKNRIAKALEMNMEAFGFEKKSSKMLSYTLQRKDISNLAATTYESVIRGLAELDKDKIIKMVGKNIQILKPKKLVKLASLN